jgi:ATP-binding cassette subfamily B protein
MDCGPACLRIIAKHHGKNLSIDYLKKQCFTNRLGSNLHGISTAAEKIGYRTVGVKISLADLQSEQPFPCIVYWQQKHFVVVYKIKKNKVYISDPALGLLTYSKEEFLQHWGNTEKQGIALVLEPVPEFHELQHEDHTQARGQSIFFITRYLHRYKKLLFQLIFGLLIASLLQLIFPFLTQSIIDVGIQQHNINFIYLLLLCQVLLFMGKTSIEILRGYILVHLSSRINISLLSDFFSKLTRLPLSFFEAKVTGDVLQRILDHQRVENFLTSGTINALFSILNLFIFSIVLGHYSSLILGVFLIGSSCYLVWVIFFMRKRAVVDYKRFNQLVVNQDKNLELIYGMQEIKLHNAERVKRWQWEHLQVKLFKINLKSLSLKQAQTGGASIINELKNILITFSAARLVLSGDITLGIMLSISYINGQLNGTIMQIAEFLQSFQDAKLSLERINEIHNKPDEDSAMEQAVTTLSSKADICLNNLCFKYDESPGGTLVLRNINLVIPRNKVTAIVGASGSGKTTLLKLLLKFYEPATGSISLGDVNLSNVNNHFWRETCGSVMQEGYIFTDSVLNNIVVGEGKINSDRLEVAVETANIHQFVQQLPLKYSTVLGANGTGLSTGQKQRILIARAVYKNPEFLFFDEATSALDAKNEKLITEKLDKFFAGKTVLVIAHRLSTVRNADKIVVLDKGEVVEVGNHSSLIAQRGFYYELIKNQLELGD